MISISTSFIIKIFVLFLCLVQFLYAQVNFKYKFKKTKTGLQYKVLIKSKTQKVKPSQRIYLTYSLFHQKDTSRIKNIIKNAKKDFLLGHGEVLKGWDEGISLLNIGDSAVFKIPPYLAYGDKKFGSIIPGSTLFLIAKIDSVEDAFYNYEKVDTLKFQSGLKKIIFKSSAAKKVENFEEVDIKFTGFVYDNNGIRQIFEKSEKNKKNLLFQLGAGQFIKGLDEGISTMRIGEKATFIIPPNLGFGNNQVGRILPNTTLYYDIELLSSKPPFFDINNKYKIQLADSCLIYLVNDVNTEKITNEDIVRFDFKAYYKDENGNSLLYDNSFQRKTPMFQRPGSGTGFPGIENALLNLSVGDYATVVIPESLIENKKKLPFLKKGMSIYFDLYIHDSFKYEFMALNNKDTVHLKSGLKYIDALLGDGNLITNSTNVKVAYSIYFYKKNGERMILDNSREREKLLEFTVGAGKNIKGFEEGVIGMKEGGMRRIIIPPELGYGDEGLPERNVPPKTNLIVDIELIRISSQE